MFPLSITSASRLLAMAWALLAWPSMAQDNAFYSQYELQLPFNVNQAVMAADLLPEPGRELIVVGMDQAQQRTLAILKFDPQNQQFILHDQLLIASKVFAFDVGVADATGRQRLYLLTKDQILRYLPAQQAQAAELVTEQAVSSMYLADVADSFTHKDFVQDINDDAKDDFILPHFEQLNLWLSDCCGRRLAQSLAIASTHEIDNDMVIYRAPELFFQDMNFDGRSDLIKVQPGVLQVYFQNDALQFMPKASLIDLAPSIFGLNWWHMKGPNDQEMDQSNLEHRKVKAILDLNADDIPDLAVQYTQSSGVLDKIIDYEFYYGVKNENKLSYAKQADAKVESDETLSDLRFLDIDSDNKMEVIVSSFDIGISQIIGALLSGSIDQNVLIFGMNEAQQFQKKPLVSQEVQMTFSLSSGSRGVPLIKIIDINGDNFNDIVFSDGDDTLRALLASPKSKRAFARRSLKQKVTMPNDASDATDADLNGDGKIDLIIKYGRADKAELINTIVVLMAK